MPARPNGQCEGADYRRRGALRALRWIQLPAGEFLYLGASARGDRLNAVYRENIAEPQIFDELNTLFRRYAAQREPGERFGDFSVRTSIVPAMLAGREFQR
jgi:sulfite reductase beta subunit-like hemoprotein